MVDLHAHYTAQSGASFWIRPRNVSLSRVVNNYSLARLNEKYRLDAKNKAEAVRRILYDSGFSYDGILPAGALPGDPQFASFYDANRTITVYSVTREHLERDVKSRGYDCTGRRQKSLYLQALAGNKNAKKSLDAAYHGEFPSRPRDAWFAIERIMHDVYNSYLKQYGCPDRLCTHLMYPAISPPLPNPVKLRGFILRTRRARDVGTLSWMLGRDLEPRELHAGNVERLVQDVLLRFGYTSTEITVMRSIVSEQADHAQGDKAADNSPGDFLLGCVVLLAPVALAFWLLSFAGYLMRTCGTAGNIIGLALLLGVLVLLIVLCKVYRGQKGRPP